MLDDLHWLGLTLLFTALVSFPYVLNRVQVRGVPRSLGNPRPDDKPHADWAERAIRAHANAVENLVLFAPVVLALAMTDKTDATTAMACGIYFAARVVHYAAYVLGVPVVRTLAYLTGLGATVFLILRLLGWM